MSEYSVEDIESLDYGVRRIGFLSWRAEFWSEEGEPIWFGQTHRRKKDAIIDMNTILSMLITDADTEDA